MKRIAFVLLLSFISSFILAGELTHDQAVKILKDAIYFNDKPKESGYNYTGIREALHYKQIFTPSLKNIKKLICANKDKELLNLYFQFLISLENNADEYKTYILGEIYLCEPEFVISNISQLNEIDKQKIINNLEFGFDNMVFFLKEKIDKLQK